MTINLACELAKEVKPHGFKRKGKAMFRVHGDGVFQIIQITRDRLYPYPLELSIGLQSMYAELRPEWFTAGGCIPRYCMINILGERDCVPNRKDINPYNLDREMERLREQGLPWLNRITTQRALVDGICELDQASTGRISWNDAMKIAPFMSCTDLESAEKVIMSILAQHKSALDSNKRWMSPEDYKRLYERCRKEDEAFERLLRMIRDKDYQSVDTYLMTNYQKNLKYAHFCMSTSKLTK